MTGRYLVKRILQSIVVLWGTFTISFVILYLVPGDPVEIMLGGAGGVSTATPQQIAAIRAQYGFNQPVIVQYFDRLGSAVRGDFGHSIETGAPVLTTIANAAVPTLQLTAAGGALAIVFGVLVAIVATGARRGITRQFLLSLPSIGVSVPTFWVGLILLALFSFHWHWLPAFGDTGWKTLILPAITIAIPPGSLIAQVLAKSLRTTLREPYVRMLRARGASERRVLLRHALHNAAVPTLSLIGVLVGNLLAGAAVVETVFSRNGIGQTAVAAVTAKDIPVVQGVVLFAATAYVLSNLAVDLILPVIDKRIRPAGGGSREIR